MIILQIIVEMIDGTAQEKVTIMMQFGVLCPHVVVCI